MASNQDQRLYQCTKCHKELDFKSKTLPCLHSYCCQCLDNSYSQCPECREPLIFDQLSLSPFLSKSLRRQQLGLGDLKCDLCMEDGVKSIAKNWCHDCQTLFCVDCSRYHKKLQRKHNSTDFDAMGKREIAEMITTDKCGLHQKLKNCYCEECNICFCDTCYQTHSTEFDECSSQPFSVEEAVLKQKSQGPKLAKKMDRIEINLKEVNEKTRKLTKELNADCDRQCYQLWINFDEMVENAKRKTEALCKEMRQITNEQVEKWRHLLEDNEKILKQLEIWRLNLNHLLRESQQDVNVVCGLQTLKSKLSFQLSKSINPEEMYQLVVTLPNRWTQFFEKIKREEAGSVSWCGGTLPAKNSGALPATKNLVLHNEWSIKRIDSYFSSILVTKKDNYVFVGDVENYSIIGFTETGEFFCECVLLSDFLGHSKGFTPVDICSTSPDILAVCCSEDCICFLERRKIAPFLVIKEVVLINKNILSLCHLNDSLMSCNTKFEICYYSITGTYRYMRKRGVSRTGDFRIRANPLTGNLWVTNSENNEIYCFNSHGEMVHSEEIGKHISDFYIDEFGQFYFCNKSGIFSLNPLKKLYSFKPTVTDPRIFALKDKIFISHNLWSEATIQIFEIFD